MSQGILVGCDVRQQWLLPWWWRHYSAHNSYPVVFIDFGMSEEALSWCRERGECLSLPSFPAAISLEQEVPVHLKAEWEGRYGVGCWIRRQGWFKKPLSLLQCPFPTGIWIDVDCQVNADLESLFHCLNFGAEIAVRRDLYRDFEFLKQGEILYNSGVIVFQKDAPILKQWIDTSREAQHLLPGDQETLSRAIFTFRPPLAELPPIYNWYRGHGPNEKAVIYHFYGGAGKMALFEKFHAQDPIESLLFRQSLEACKGGL